MDLDRRSRQYTNMNTTYDRTLVSNAAIRTRLRAIGVTLDASRALIADSRRLIDASIGLLLDIELQRRAGSLTYDFAQISNADRVRSPRLRPFARHPSTASARVISACLAD